MAKIRRSVARATKNLNERVDALEASVVELRKRVVLLEEATTRQLVGIQRAYAAMVLEK